MISELSTNRGRADLVLKTKKYIYIFELKFNKKPDVALKQIEDRKYYERFLHEKKQIVLATFNRSESQLLLDCKTAIIPQEK